MLTEQSAVSAVRVQRSFHVKTLKQTFFPYLYVIDLCVALILDSIEARVNHTALRT